MGEKIKTFGIYAGSFDPITDGHLWVVEQGRHLFDRFAVVVAKNPGKNCTFTLEERLEMLQKICPDLECLVMESKFLANFAYDMGATHLLRGVRTTIDYQAEVAMARVNHDINSNMQTVYVFPPDEIGKISSSVVKSLIGPDGWEDIVKKYVPKTVLKRLIKKYNQGKEKNESY